MQNEIISTMNYNEKSPIYNKIKQEFTHKLIQKYQCENYDIIVDYIFDYAFKKKLTKSACIQKMNPIFNNKAEFMIDYLWEIVRKAENSSEESYSDSDYNDYKIKTNSLLKDIKLKRTKRHKRERSRSYSREKIKNKFDLDTYPNYPPLIPRGFYPPKGRFNRPMMPMGGPYPPYMIPPIMKR